MMKLNVFSNSTMFPRQMDDVHAQLPPAGEERNVSSYSSPIKPAFKSYITDSFMQTRTIIN